MEIADLTYSFNIFLMILVATVLAISGLKKQPGIGVLVALLIIFLQLASQEKSLKEIGFIAPENWLNTILSGLGFGILIQALSVTLIEPISEKITRQKHDHSLINAVKGNWKIYLLWLMMVWFLVAIIEEAIFRGYFIVGLTTIMENKIIGNLVSILFSSFLFGLSHGYQNRSGVMSTGIVGFILGIIFISNDYNLWLVIFTHGFIDTAGISLIALDYDKKLRIRV